jgi:hypothetical protein
MSFRSILNLNSDDLKDLLKYLQLADSAHDFKGQRSESNIATSKQFSLLLNSIKQSSMSSSTIEHTAENQILDYVKNITEKNIVSKLINNSEYNFEITINNELNDITDESKINNHYKSGTTVIKELKLNIQFDRISHGNKLKNKKFFSKGVLNYFMVKYKEIYGMSNEYIIDAVNIPITYFLSTESSTEEPYIQLVEESNKWDMAPTSAPQNYKDRCNELIFNQSITEWSIKSSETIFTSFDNIPSTIYNRTNLENISSIIIDIKIQYWSKLNLSFLNDSNYLYILLNETEYNLIGDYNNKTIPILTQNIDCLTVQLQLNSIKNNCFGYIVFINKTSKKLCLLASNAYRKNNDLSIGVNNLSTNLNTKEPHPDLVKITNHLECNIYTFILDIKRTGDWGQIIQVKNQYDQNRKITLTKIFLII